MLNATEKLPVEFVPVEVSLLWMAKRSFFSPINLLYFVRLFEDMRNQPHGTIIVVDEYSLIIRHCT